MSAFNLKRAFAVLWDYFLVTFGTVLYCLAWTSFLLPNGTASGGGTGLCAIIYFATGIPVSYSFFVLNALLLILAFISLGKSFGVKTIYVILLSSVLLKVFPEFDGWVVHFDNRLLVSIVGGVVEAVGIGIILLRGGSSGGTDIAAMIINKYWPVSPGKVYLYSDFFILGSILLIPGKTFEDMIYGYATMFTFSFMVDYVLLGRKSSVQILVFSKKYREVADHIIKNMDRGVTALNSVGWYSGAESKVLLIIARKAQLHQIVAAVKEIDNKAFVSVSTATSVYGEGFEEIKTGFKLKKKDRKNDGNKE